MPDNSPIPYMVPVGQPAIPRTSLTEALSEADPRTGYRGPRIEEIAAERVPGMRRDLPGPILTFLQTRPGETQLDRAERLRRVLGIDPGVPLDEEGAPPADTDVSTAAIPAGPSAPAGPSRRVADKTYVIRKPGEAPLYSNIQQPGAEEVKFREPLSREQLIADLMTEGGRETPEGVIPGMSAEEAGKALGPIPGVDADADAEEKFVRDMRGQGKDPEEARRAYRESLAEVRGEAPKEPLTYEAKIKSRSKMVSNITGMLKKAKGTEEYNAILRHGVQLMKLKGLDNIVKPEATVQTPYGALPISIADKFIDKGAEKPKALAFQKELNSLRNKERIVLANQPNEITGAILAEGDQAQALAQVRSDIAANEATFKSAYPTDFETYHRSRRFDIRKRIFTQAKANAAGVEGYEALSNDEKKNRVEAEANKLEGQWGLR